MIPDPDLALVVGLGLVLLSWLSFVAAWIDGRTPVIGTVICLAGFALIVFAFAYSPVRYSPGDLPMIVYTVLGRYLF